MKTNDIRTAICPKCGKTYNEAPALSREDNATSICPDCGTREALEYLGLPSEEQEKILEVIHQYRTKTQS